MLEVDEYGLDEIDRKLLTTIIDRFGGGPVGLELSRHRSRRTKGRSRISTSRISSRSASSSARRGAASRAVRPTSTSAIPTRSRRETRRSCSE